MNWKRLWPHLRTLLILTHVLGVLVMALPSNYRLGQRSHWKAEKQQTELAGWADRLGVEKASLESFLWDTTQIYLKLRKKIIKPFALYADYTGTRQGWTMFANPRRSSGRFEVSVEVAGEWQLVFKPHSSRYSWKQYELEHNRVRKLLGRLASNPHQIAYRELTGWLARELAVDFPKATRAKIELITWKLQEPAAVRAGTPANERRTQYQEFDLEALR